MPAYMWSCFVISRVKVIYMSMNIPSIFMSYCFSSSPVTSVSANTYLLPHLSLPCPFRLFFFLLYLVKIHGEQMRANVIFFADLCLYCRYIAASSYTLILQEGECVIIVSISFTMICPVFFVTITRIYVVCRLKRMSMPRIMTGRFLCIGRCVGHTLR